MSHSYDADYMVPASPLPRMVAKYGTLVMPFENSVWACLGFALLAMPFVVLGVAYSEVKRFSNMMK